MSTSGRGSARGPWSTPGRPSVAARRSGVMCISPGARPVVVEDGAFIGSRCIVTEGVLIEEGAVLGANVTITGSTPIIDVSGSEATTHHGRVPARSVVVPGTRAKRYPAGEFQVSCAMIVGTRTATTNRKKSMKD